MEAGRHPQRNTLLNMILQRVEQADWLSNSYLVIDRPGGSGVLVDSNGVIEPLLERVDREGTTDLTHIIVTHDHWDHVVGIGDLAKERGVPGRRPSDNGGEGRLPGRHPARRRRQAPLR